MNRNRSFAVKGEERKSVDYGTLGILIGVLVVVVSFVWVTFLTMTQDREKAGDGVMWVG